MKRRHVTDKSRNSLSNAVFVVFLGFVVVVVFLLLLLLVFFWFFLGGGSCLLVLVCFCLFGCF